MGLFDAIAKSIGALPSLGGSESVLGIDIGSSSIKIVQLRRDHGKAVLETYGAISLGPYAELHAGQVARLGAPKLVDALRDLMRESNITAKSIGVAIPFTSSLTSVIELPPMSQDQLQRVIPLEARKYIPVPMNEITLDWFVIPKDEFAENVDPSSSGEKKKDVIEVLLVAIHNDILNTYQSVMGELQLQPQFYELEIFSAARSSLGHGVAPVMMVDIGASTTKVSIIERGIVRMSHTINQGGQEMTLAVSRAMNWDFEKSERVKREQGMALAADPAQANVQTAQAAALSPASVRTALLSTLGRIIPDTHKVLLSYGKKYQKNVPHVILTGGGAAVSELVPYAQERLGSEVQLAQPFEKIEAPAFLVDVLKEVGPEFAVAVGAALRLIQ
jgi:type IV pilus assembly protein PilM